MRTIVTNLCIWAALLLGSPAMAEESRVALVIGQSEYQSLSKLANPVPDAKAIATALREHGFKVTEHYDLARAELLDALEEFSATADQASVALVYYAGHGMEISGRNVLAPKDMEIDCEKKTPRRAIELDQVFAAVSGAPSQIVLLDACRNDPFPQCPNRSAGSGSGFRGFARVTTEGHSLLVANATLSGQLAADGDPGAHSPFASALLARFSSDPRAYLRDLLDLTAADVSKASRGAQVPEILTRGGAPRICLDQEACGGIVAAEAKTAATPGAPGSPRPSNLEQAARGWADVQSTQSKVVLEAFLREFPDGFYAELARAKLEGMKPGAGEAIVAAPPRVAEPQSAPVETAPVETAAALTPQAVQGPKSGHAPVQDCDRLAADSTNPDSVAAGVDFGKMDEARAIPACEEAVRAYPQERRFGFQLARAYLQANKPELAKPQLEALSKDGYPIAITYLGYIYAEGKAVAKDENEALRLFRQAADAGDPSAALTLGGSYEWGRGVAKDEAEAVRWYRRAADGGSTRSMLYLGDKYVEGQLGLPKDDAEAAGWFRKVADRGEAEGLYRLGLMYQGGRGVPKDVAEAEQLFAKGDEQKNATAMVDIGHRFADGRGVAEDDAEALKWFRKAAELGDQYGMFYSGMAYGHGLGVAKDAAEAARWYRKAADLGHTTSMKNLADLYEEGAGVAKDPAEALRWRRAAKAGASPTGSAPVEAKAALVRSFDPDEYEPVALAFSRDGTRILVLASGGYFSWLDPTGAREVSKFGQSSCCQLALSPNGKQAATGTYDEKAVRLWDLKSGEVVKDLKEHSDYVVAVNFSADGKRLASGSYDATIGLWDPASGKLLRKFEPAAGKVHSVAFSPDGSLLASGHNNGDIKLWDVASGGLRQSLKADGYSVNSLAFSPDGALLAARGGFSINLWDVATGRMVRSLAGVTVPINFSSMAMSPDGAQIASGDSDGGVRLWDVAEGKQLQELEAHIKGVSAVAFSPDGKLLASGSGDKTVKLWNLGSIEAAGR